MIIYSDIESNRFGIKVFRGKNEVFDICEVRDVVGSNNFDLIIVRYPSSTIHNHHELLELPHCRVIHADSLLYYKAPLQTIDVHPLRNNLVFEKITLGDDDMLDDICKEIFAGYQNHYYSNPFLDKGKIIEGYFEWAKSYATQTEGKDDECIYCHFLPYKNNIDWRQNDYQVLDPFIGIKISPQGITH